MKKTDDQIARNVYRIAGAAFRPYFCDEKVGKTFVVVVAASYETAVRRMVVVVVAKVASVSVGVRTVPIFVAWQEVVLDFGACRDQQGSVVTASFRCSCDLIVIVVILI